MQKSSLSDLSEEVVRVQMVFTEFHWQRTALVSKISLLLLLSNYDIVYMKKEIQVLANRSLIVSVYHSRNRYRLDRAANTDT